MGRGSNDDAEYDEFDAWARWVADRAEVESPFCGPDDRDADGRWTTES